jgi:hypothetical protein
MWLLGNRHEWKDYWTVNTLNLAEGVLHLRQTRRLFKSGRMGGLCHRYETWSAWVKFPSTKRFRLL